jgi:ParB family chromosome partitioning protein
VTNTLRLAQLPDAVRTLLADGQLTEGHARALLGLETEEQMVELAQRVQAEKLSVRRTEEIVREYLSSPQTPRQAGPEENGGTPEEFDEASRLMREALELPVRVRPLRKGGKVEIRFRERAELEAILTLLAPGEHSP